MARITVDDCTKYFPNRFERKLINVLALERVVRERQKRQTNMPLLHESTQ